MGKVLVIGRGPAGISASIYMQRGGLEVTVVAKDDGALSRAEKVENLYGLEKPLTGREAIPRGIAGVRRLGVTFKEAEIVSLTRGASGRGFLAKTAGGEKRVADGAGRSGIEGAGHPRIPDRSGVLTPTNRPNQLTPPEAG